MDKNLIKVSKDSVENLTLYNVRQKRVWGLIAKDLQQYSNLPIDWDTITLQELKKFIPLDKLNCHYNCIVDLSFSDKAHRRRAVDEIFEMASAVIVQKETDSMYEKFTLFQGVTYEKGASTCCLQMGLNGLRWMLNFSKNFTLFPIESFLKLSTAYSQELFLLLSEFYKTGKLCISIEKFKERMGCPESYDMGNIKQRILIPTLNEFNRIPEVKISFQCHMYSKEEKGSHFGRKKLNMLNFTILTKGEDELFYNKIDEQ